MTINKAVKMFGTAVGADGAKLAKTYVNEVKIRLNIGEAVAIAKSADVKCQDFHAMLVDEYGERALVGMSHFQLGKFRVMFEHYGSDAERAVNDVRDLAEPTWTNVHKFVVKGAAGFGSKPATDGEGADGEGEGEGDGVNEVSTSGRFVKVNLDDPLQALLKLDDADVALLATAIAALLDDRAMLAAAA